MNTIYTLIIGGGIIAATGAYNFYYKSYFVKRKEFGNTIKNRLKEEGLISTSQDVDNASVCIKYGYPHWYSYHRCKILLLTLKLDLTLANLNEVEFKAIQTSAMQELAECNMKKNLLRQKLKSSAEDYLMQLENSAEIEQAQTQLNLYRRINFSLIVSEEKLRIRKLIKDYTY